MPNDKQLSNMLQSTYGLSFSSCLTGQNSLEIPPQLTAVQHFMSFLAQ